MIDRPVTAPLQLLMLLLMMMRLVLMLRTTTPAPITLLLKRIAVVAVGVLLPLLLQVCEWMTSHCVFMTMTVTLAEVQVGSDGKSERLEQGQLQMQRRPVRQYPPPVWA